MECKLCGQNTFYQRSRGHIVCSTATGSSLQGGSESDSSSESEDMSLSE